MLTRKVDSAGCRDSARRISLVAPTQTRPTPKSRTALSSSFCGRAQIAGREVADEDGIVALHLREVREFVDADELDIEGGRSHGGGEELVLLRVGRDDQDAWQARTLAKLVARLFWGSGSPDIDLNVVLVEVRLGKGLGKVNRFLPRTARLSAHPGIGRREEPHRGG